MPYVKLDCGILDSTVWIDRDRREIFITALLMASPKECNEPIPQYHVDRNETTGFVAPKGWYGFVEAAGPGIVRRAMVEPIPGMAALTALGDPDPESRSPKFEGRRLIRVVGGYLILNFIDYRDRDYTMAERARRYRQRKRNGANDEPITEQRDNVTSHRDITQSESESESKSEEPKMEKSRAVRSPAHRLGEDFILTPERFFVAEAENIDPDREFAKFKDHWRSASGATSRKLDWDAAWRNWCRKAADFAPVGKKVTPKVKLRTADEVEAEWNAKHARQ